MTRAGTPFVATKVLVGRYVDSMVAMRLAKDLAGMDGVLDAAALMGTPANRELLAEGGFLTPGTQPSTPDDLVVALRTRDPGAAAAALDAVEELLVHRSAPKGRARSLDAALAAQPSSNLVSISLPGEYAAQEARRALESGLHVFCFSSDVSVQDEVALKKIASDRGLLCMGPDCGTSILGGIGLGFANVVRRGPVGVTGGSGTGIQAVTSMLDRLGIGTSHAIGSGSRDLHDEVGGTTTFAALSVLEADEATKVIVIVSKPGGPDTGRRITKAANASRKRVIRCVLGDPTADARTLDDAVALAAHAVGAGVARPPSAPPPELGELRARVGARRLVRGLFSGGSLCAEAQVVLRSAGLPVGSNAPLPGTVRTEDGARSVGNALIDLGTAAFVRGRPHPMIDARVRAGRLVEEADDPDVGVVLLDIVLGRNAADSPAGDLADAIAQAAAPRRGSQGPVVVASVIGTDADPQGVGPQTRILRDAGAIVMPTNATAAALAAALVAEVNP